MSTASDGSSDDERQGSTAVDPPVKEDVTASAPAPANPSEEPEDRPKSPPGGDTSDRDDPVAEDPEGAPSAYGLLYRMIGSMALAVVLLTLTAVTHSPIVLIIALLAVVGGLSFVIWGVFQMTSTD